jgi:hypothetical protein
MLSITGVVNVKAARRSPGEGVTTMLTIQEEIELTLTNVQLLHDRIKGTRSSMLKFHLRGVLARLEQCLDHVRGDEPANEPYALEVYDSESKC